MAKSQSYRGESLCEYSIYATINFTMYKAVLEPLLCFIRENWKDHLDCYD